MSAVFLVTVFGLVLVLTASNVASHRHHEGCSQCEDDDSDDDDSDDHEYSDNDPPGGPSFGDAGQIGGPGGMGQGGGPGGVGQSGGPGGMGQGGGPGGMGQSGGPGGMGQGGGPGGMGQSGGPGGMGQGGGPGGMGQGGGPGGMGQGGGPGSMGHSTSNVNPSTPNIYWNMTMPSSIIINLNGTRPITVNHNPVNSLNFSPVSAVTIPERSLILQNGTIKFPNNTVILLKYAPGAVPPVARMPSGVLIFANGTKVAAGTVKTFPPPGIPLNATTEGTTYPPVLLPTGTLVFRNGSVLAPGLTMMSMVFVENVSAGCATCKRASG